MAIINSLPFEALCAICMEAHEQTEALAPVALAERMMDHSEVAMHSPDHHFIVPAALITYVRGKQGVEISQLQRDLKKIAERAAKVPGGVCGMFGCCGAAVGCGVFAAVLLDTSPKKKDHWAAINQFTARCLDSIASVDGPRCCKRVTYLALNAAVEHAPKLLGVSLGEPQNIICHRYSLNRECKGLECPYFPT